MLKRLDRNIYILFILYFFNFIENVGPYKVFFFFFLKEAPIKVKFKRNICVCIIKQILQINYNSLLLLD